LNRRPEAFLRIARQSDGRTRNDRKYVAGPLELIAAVSASSVSYDLHDKLRAYQRNALVTGRRLLVA
jgi:hypothetical protein